MLQNVKFAKCKTYKKMLGNKLPRLIKLITIIMKNYG